MANEPYLAYADAEKLTQLYLSRNNPKSMINVIYLTLLLLYELVRKTFYDVPQTIATGKKKGLYPKCLCALHYTLTLNKAIKLLIIFM